MNVKKRITNYITNSIFCVFSLHSDDLCTLNKLNHNENVNAETLAKMLMYGKEASNRKQ